MYTPVEGNYEHWALYLENGSEHTIYEVTGETPSFKTNVVNTEPKSTRRHKRNIFIADILPTDLPEFHEAVKIVKPDNSTVHWNCQDYVLEIIDQLEENMVVNKDDGEYQDAMKEVKSYFGPL